MKNETKFDYKHEKVINSLYDISMKISNNMYKKLYPHIFGNND